MSFARDVIAQLRRAIATVSVARDSTTAVQSQADEIIADLRTATDGSTAEKPAEAIVRLEQAKVKLDEAMIEFQAGDAAVEEYIAYLERGGESEGSPPPTGGQRPTGGLPPIPASVRRAAERIPVWQPRAPTRGLAWLDEDGEPVDFVSGRDRSAREGLCPEYALRVVTTDHVEGKLAARMRQPGGPVNVTTVLNKEPCEGPVGCDATLPHIIPRDATVTVYVKNEAGVRLYGIYHGTGKGIA